MEPAMPRSAFWSYKQLSLIMLTNELPEWDIWVQPWCVGWHCCGQVTQTFIIGQQFRIQEIMFKHSPLSHILLAAKFNTHLLDGGAPPAHFEDGAAGLDDGDQHQGGDAGHHHVQLHVCPLSRLGGIITPSFHVSGHCNTRIKVRSGWEISWLKEYNENKMSFWASLNAPSDLSRPLWVTRCPQPGRPPACSSLSCSAPPAPSGPQGCPRARYQTHSCPQ